MNKQQVREHYLRKLKTILREEVLLSAVDFTPQHQIFRMLSYRSLIKIVFDNWAIEDISNDEKIYLDFKSINNFTGWWKSHSFKETKIKPLIAHRGVSQSMGYIVRQGDFVGIHKVSFEEIKNMKCSKEEKLSWIKEHCPTHYQVIMELRKLKEAMKNVVPEM